MDLLQLPPGETASGTAYADQFASLISPQDETAEIPSASAGPGIARDNTLLGQTGLDLQPLPAPPADNVSALGVLRDDPLEALLPGGVEEGGAVLPDVVAVSDRKSVV